MMTDPIADMLTRIRNGLRIGRATVRVPSSRVKVGIAQALVREGYLCSFEIVESPVRNDLRLDLKYSPTGERVIRHIGRVSRPGRRVYASFREMRPVMRGLGVHIVSTPRGILSDRECRRDRVGGEILADVW